MTERIQFRTADHGKTTARVQWSDDAGATWHEPGEPSTYAVVQTWRQIMWNTYGF